MVFLCLCSNQPINELKTGALGLALDIAMDQTRREVVVVDECIEGTPAAACGQIEPGDILVAVDGNPTAGQSVGRSVDDSAVP